MSIVRRLCLLLGAAGVILMWGVAGSISDIDVSVVGLMLYVIGSVGWYLAVIFGDSPRRGGARRQNRP